MKEWEFVDDSKKAWQQFLHACREAAFKSEPEMEKSNDLQQFISLLMGKSAISLNADGLLKLHLTWLDFVLDFIIFSIESGEGGNVCPLYHL